MKNMRYIDKLLRIKLFYKGIKFVKFLFVNFPVLVFNKVQNVLFPDMTARNFLNNGRNILSSALYSSLSLLRDFKILKPLDQVRHNIDFLRLIIGRNLFFYDFVLDLLNLGQ